MGIDERSGGTPEADDVPRLVAWLRSERPATTGAEVALLLGRVAPDRLLRLERILDDLARGCRPPSPTDLAAGRARALAAQPRDQARHVVGTRRAARPFVDAHVR